MLSKYFKKRPLRTKIGHKIRAVDVLYNKMVFYNQEANEMGLKIWELLKQGDKARGDKLADMYKAMMRINDLAIECATKLAPYQSAKLESVEVKKTVEHRYVIRAPAQLKSVQDWSQQVKLEALPPPVLRNTPKPNITPVNTQNNIQDAEIIEEDDYEYSNSVRGNNHVSAGP